MFLPRVAKIGKNGTINSTRIDDAMTTVRTEENDKARDTSRRAVVLVEKKLLFLFGPQT